MPLIRRETIKVDTAQVPKMAAPAFRNDLLAVSTTPIQVTGSATLEDDPPPRPAPGVSLGGTRPGIPAPGGTRSALPVGASPTSVRAPIGWQLGWIQLQLSEVNWAYYEGAKLQDGSALIRYDTADVRKTGVCRDTLIEGTLWFRGARDGDKDVSVQKIAGTESLPLRLTAIHGDMPSDEFSLTVNNSITGAVNQLRACEMRLKFCTVLTLQKISRSYQIDYEFLKRFEWTAGARYRVNPPLVPTAQWTAAIEGTDGCSIGSVSDGPPSADLVKLLTDPSALHCNSEAALATTRAKARCLPTRSGPPR